MKKTVLLLTQIIVLLSTISSITFAQSWTQLGLDMDGEAANDWSGYSVSLSSDGSRVAIGAIENDGNGLYSGHVRVFELSSGSWTQLGSDIDGEAANDYSGGSVSLSSDGSRVAIGAPVNDGNGLSSGHVRVYELISGTWTQLGDDIDGEAAFDYSGYSVSLSSDGSRVAIGALNNDGNGDDSGHVRVFELSSGSWIKLGDDIDGEAAYDYSGWSVSLSSDGSRVAIGAYLNDGNGLSSGHVRVYELISGTWTKLGLDIDGEAVSDYSGWSVSLSSDGSRVAIGAYFNDGNGSNSGHVRIFYYNGTAWTQLGSDINGEAAGDNSGSSVSLSSDGSRVAIGAFLNNGVNGGDSGHVRVFSTAPEINLKQSVTNIADGGSHNYGSKVTGTNTDVVFTIENTGTSNLTLTTPLTLGGTNADQFSFQTQPTSPIAASGSTTFTVRFSPTSVGAKTASIAIANNDSDENPYDLTLNGTGLAPEINLKQSVTNIADGGSHNYGSKVSGSNTDVVFTIENTGTSNLTLTTPLTLGGADAGQFSFQTQPTSPIAGSGSTTFTVRFSPTSVGAKTATIAIANNDSDENPYDLTLNGIGLIYPYIIISGYVKYSNGAAVEGVEVAFSNGGSTVTTDVNGDYHRYITRGWSGTATPSMTGLLFTPSSYTYSSVATDIPNQNYVAELNHVTISGYVRDGSNIGIEGATVAFTNGGATVITSSSGYYISSFTNGWGGTSTATKDGWTFTPASYTYSAVTTNLADQDYVGTDLTLAVNEHLSSLPTEFTVLPAYPNPFNPSTTISYGLDSDSYVTLEIYDISGKLIATLQDKNQTQGWHSVIWNGTNQFGVQVPAGLYFNRITSGNDVKTTKLMLLK